MKTTAGVFSTMLNLPSILPKSAIFGFLCIASNHIILIFKNYLYQAIDNKNLNFNIPKSYLTKIRDIEVKLKDNDKYDMKWTVTSIMIQVL